MVIYILNNVYLLSFLGQEDYDRVRPLSYPNTSVILLCFAIDSPDSLDNVQEKVFIKVYILFFLRLFINLIPHPLIKWVEELTEHCNGVPIVLVGCKNDLRNDQKTLEELAKTSQVPVTFEEVKIQQNVVQCTLFINSIIRGRKLLKTLVLTGIWNALPN
jgi:Ras family protein A